MNKSGFGDKSFLEDFNIISENFRKGVANLHHVYMLEGIKKGNWVDSFSVQSNTLASSLKVMILQGSH